MLFGAPKAVNDVLIRVTTPLESRHYVDMTTDVLKKHGIEVETSHDSREFHIPGNQTYKPKDHMIPGDYSSVGLRFGGSRDYWIKGHC